jgi:hypothetical protein
MPKDGHREIFFCEYDYPSLEPVTGKSVGKSPCKPITFKKRARKVIIELH